MDYPGVDLASFARDAGFADGRASLDCRFLKHPGIGLYLELFTYHHPEGDQTIHRRKTNDLGGIRHMALEVADAVATSMSSTTTFTWEIARRSRPGTKSAIVASIPAQRASRRRMIVSPTRRETSPAT